MVTGMPPGPGTGTGPALGTASSSGSGTGSFHEIDNPLRVDGFDTYADGTDIDKGWTTNALNAGHMTPVTGRGGVGKAMQWSEGTTAIHRPVSNVRVAAGVAYYQDAGFAVSNFGFIFSFYTASTAIFSLTAATSGHLYLRTLDNVLMYPGTVTARSDKALLSNAWHYIEITYKITDSSVDGDLVVKVNEEEWMRLAAGVDIDVNNLAIIDSIALRQQVNFADKEIDDFYVIPGGTESDFLGDIRDWTLLPNNNGAYSEWIGSDGDRIDNYKLINENAPGSDGDTTHIKREQVGGKDSWVFDNISLSSVQEVVGVQATSVLKKDSPGTRTGNHFFRHGITDYDGKQFFPDASYTYQENMFRQNPHHQHKHHNPKSLFQ